jgi:hypothetical protein
MEYNSALTAEESPLAARAILLVLIIAVCGMAGAVLGALFLNQPPAQVITDVTPVAPQPDAPQGDVETGALPPPTTQPAVAEPPAEETDDPNDVEPEEEEEEPTTPPPATVVDPKEGPKTPAKPAPTVTKTPDRVYKAPVRQSRFGFLSVKTSGTKRAKVYIDGREAGYAPLYNFRSRIGRRQVKVVDFSTGQPGRFVVEDVVVHPKNTRSNPALLQIDM